MFTKDGWYKSFIFNNIRLRREWLHAHRLGLAQRLRRHCLGVGVRPLLRVWDTRAPVARGHRLQAVETIASYLIGAGLAEVCLQPVRASPLFRPNG